jgi:SAM-dependent methyltransferase
MRPFRYSDYESRLMDLDYIRMLQRPRVQFFQGCQRVVDLACGPGVFLELLKEAGIEATGVDRDGEIVEKARQKGLKVIQADIFDYLERTQENFDGIFCSHLLEHLPFDRVIQFVEWIVKRLDLGGRVVLVLPNPGSIRLHLFGFWRDPEHVRFYTGNLIASVCKHYGLEVEYTNEDETPNRLETPRLEPISLPPSHRGWKGLFQSKTGEMKLFLEEFNKQVEVFNKKIETFSETLNKIWSRDDEIVLVCRKEG